MRLLLERGRTLLEKQQTPSLSKQFKALGGSVKAHLTNNNLVVVRLPKGNEQALQDFLNLHGIEQESKAITGSTYELAFVSKTKWPGPLPQQKSFKKPSKSKSKSNWRREDIHGVTVTFHPKIDEKEEKSAVSKLLHAREILKTLRFKEAWGGNIVIAPGKGSVSGTYQRRTDTTTLYSHVSLRTIIHEFGHRWWYRNMTRPRRLQFIAWVKAGLSPVSAYGGKDPWEAFAEAFKYFVLTKEMTTQQVETFKLMARGGRFESVRSNMAILAEMRVLLEAIAGSKKHVAYPSDYHQVVTKIERSRLSAPIHAAAEDELSRDKTIARYLKGLAIAVDKGDREMQLHFFKKLPRSVVFHTIPSSLAADLK